MNTVITVLIFAMAFLITAKAHGATAMDDSWLHTIFTKIGEYAGYVWIVIIALWGGTANYITRLRKQQVPFSMFELIGEWTISGFAGLLVALVCSWLAMDFAITAALAGIAGHAGGRSIHVIEDWLLKKLNVNSK